MYNRAEIYYSDLTETAKEEIKDAGIDLDDNTKSDAVPLFILSQEDTDE